MLLALVLALAGPGDKRLVLRPGQKSIEKIAPGAEAVEGAELLPSGNEVLIEKPGLVFVFHRREVHVFEVAASFTPRKAKPTGCPVIRDADCYEKWRAAAEPGDKLVFELEGLEAEARAAQRELDSAGLSHVKVALSGAGVRLKGARDEQERRRALQAIWPAILGPLRLE